MAGYWIKFYIEILDDPKMATLSDRLWRRFYELCLMCGKTQHDGNLPDTGQIAWVLRKTAEDILPDLLELEELGLIKKTETGWEVINFVKRQERIDDAEKMRQYRDRKHKREYYGEPDISDEPVVEPVTNPVTDALPEVTQIKNQNQITDKEKEEIKTTTAQAPSMSTVARLFLDTWMVKRANSAQLALITEAESTYPLETIQAFIAWARVENMTFGHAVNSSRKALANWSKPKPSPNGSKPTGELAPVDMSDEERRRRYGDWGKVKT